MTNSKLTRFITFILAITLAFSSLVFCVSAADNAVVSVASASGKTGETVTVSVDLSQNPGIIAMELNVSFDSSKLELVSASDAGKLNGYGSSPSYEGGAYTLYWEDGTATANNSATGTIATMTFKLKEGCDKATVSISGNGYDTDLNTISVSASSSTISNTSSTTATTAPSTTKPTTTKPTTTKPTTTKKNTTTTTKKSSTTTNYVVDLEEDILSTTEESTTDLFALFETTTEEPTTETTTEETTTEPEDEGPSTLSKTKIVLIILMACFAVVGVAVIVSMVRKAKRG